MEEFVRLSKRSQRKLTLEQYAEYKKRERAYNYENSDCIRGITKSRVWHFVLWHLLRLMRLSKQQKLFVIADDRERKKNPVVYACTHIGYDDVAMTFEAVKSPCWLFWGNPGVAYRTLDGKMAEKNGAVFLDTYDKEDRKIAKQLAIRVLKQGMSLLIYPEGAWNLTENLPVMKLYRGVVDMAMETGADIVPIAIEQYGKNFYVNIGENINYSNREKNRQELTDELRDALATLKWEIWERMGVEERQSVPENLQEHFAKNILEEAWEAYPYTMEEWEAEWFHDKDKPEPEEVFAFLEKLPVKKETVFLLRKTHGGR